MKNRVQKFGKFLSGMVMPNIGALIAFGFLAALFIDTGWIPNKQLNSMVSPMLTYLIPILIASTGGKMVGGDRGRVVGAIAVIGAIMSDTSITMLMAAMVMGPLGGFCIKKFDEKMEGHIPAGFEMLINNFSAGIIGMILAILGYAVVGPVMSVILTVLAAGVHILVSHSVLPLVAIFIEPAKVLFLNNAINHGIFTPLATGHGTQEPFIIAVQNPEICAQLRKMNAEIMGVESDPYYGAPTIVIVLAPESNVNGVKDGSLILGNMMLAAHSIGLASCWINREDGMFASEEGKKLMKDWNLPEGLMGVGALALGYASAHPHTVKPRKEDYYRIIK